MSDVSYEKVSYNGKNFTIPMFAPEAHYVIRPQKVVVPSRTSSPILMRMNSTWDIDRFFDPAHPVLLPKLGVAEQSFFASRRDIPEVLDLPIKMPGTPYKLPSCYVTSVPIVERIANFYHSVNPSADDYICYFTLRHSLVKKGTAHHPAPVHVDGLQGKRWHPRKRINNSFTMTNVLPTSYFVQPFDLTALDESLHDYFWEMNYQVAETNGAHCWTGEPYVIEMMDAYCPHYGSVSELDEDVYRFWIRLTYEERIYDRLGNAHNAAFDYDWEMVPRDIEQLHLRAFHEASDPSLRVFPHQALDGSPNPKGVKTLPNLWPLGQAPAPGKGATTKGRT